jgi:hypothetical protein
MMHDLDLMVERIDLNGCLRPGLRTQGLEGPEHLSVNNDGDDDRLRVGWPQDGDGIPNGAGQLFDPGVERTIPGELNRLLQLGWNDQRRVCHGRSRRLQTADLCHVAIDLIERATQRQFSVRHSRGRDVRRNTRRGASRKKSEPQCRGTDPSRHHPDHTAPKHVTRRLPAIGANERADANNPRLDSFVADVAHLGRDAFYGFASMKSCHLLCGKQRRLLDFLVAELHAHAGSVNQFACKLIDHAQFCFSFELAACQPIGLPTLDLLEG